MATMMMTTMMMMMMMTMTMTMMMMTMTMMMSMDQLGAALKCSFSSASSYWSCFNPDAFFSSLRPITLSIVLAAIVCSPVCHPVLADIVFAVGILLALIGSEIVLG